jgi:hypothetical protein
VVYKVKWKMERKERGLWTERNPVDREDKDRLGKEPWTSHDVVRGGSCSGVMSFFFFCFLKVEPWKRRTNEGRG